MTSRARRWLTRFTTGTTTAGLLLVGLPAVTGAVSGPPVRDRTGGTLGVAADLVPASHKARHPHRKIKLYRVRRGDTASSVAVRFHAWTDQLIAINHTSSLYVGQVIRVPVVVQAARKCTRHNHHRTGYLTDNKHSGGSKAQGKPDRPKKPGGRPSKPGKPHKPKKSKHSDKSAGHRHPDHGWVHAHAGRAEVRHLIVKKAKRVGVNPELALAIAWQESGWQHHVKSSAGALGAMQVMPGTGRWMSAYLGRDLNLRNLHDNVSAGVVLIKVLRSQAKLKRAVAGYYQGLAGVRQYGMYRSTKRYVANVLALKKALERGWDPA